MLVGSPGGLWGPLCPHFFDAWLYGVLLPALGWPHSGHSVSLPSAIQGGWMAPDHFVVILLYLFSDMHLCDSLEIRLALWHSSWHPFPTRPTEVPMLPGMAAPDVWLLPVPLLSFLLSGSSFCPNSTVSSGWLPTKTFYEISMLPKTPAIPSPSLTLSNTPHFIRSFSAFDIHWWGDWSDLNLAVKVDSFLWINSLNWMYSRQCYHAWFEIIYLFIWWGPGWREETDQWVMSPFLVCFGCHFRTAKAN